MNELLRVTEFEKGDLRFKLSDSSLVLSCYRVLFNDSNCFLPSSIFARRLEISEIFFVSAAITDSLLEIVLFLSETVFSNDLLFSLALFKEYPKKLAVKINIIVMKAVRTIFHLFFMNSLIYNYNML